MKGLESQQLAAIVELSDDAIIGLDLEGRILTWNPGAEKLLGYPAAEAIGQNIDIVIPHHLRGENAERLSRLREGALVQNYEAARLKKDQTAVMVSTRILALRDSAGIVVGACEILCDVTARKREEMALRESLERYSSLFENMLNGFAFCRMHFADGRPVDFTYLKVNRAFEMLTGLKNVVGKRASEVLPGIHEADPGLLEIYGRVVRTGVPERFEMFVQVTQQWFEIAVHRPSEEHFVALFDVITKRKQAEMEAERLAAIVLSSDDAIISKGLDGRILTWNPAAERLLGYSAGEIIGKEIALLIPENRKSEEVAILEMVASGRNAQHYETIRLKKSGVLVPVSLTISAVEDGSGKIVGASKIMRDISQRKRVEEDLRVSEQRYRRLFEAAKDGVLILDAQTGVIIDVNPFLVQLLGYPREALLGKKLWELGCFKDVAASQDGFEELRQREYIRYDDKPLEAADGRRIEVEFVSNVYEVNHRKVIQCNIRDISERKRAEAQARVHKEQLRGLSSRIENLREEDRTRISREIHDELGQMLTGIKMDLRWMEHRLDEFGDDHRANLILDKLVATGELADATIKTVQRIAADLRPGILDKLGLPMALQYEASKFQERSGITCRLAAPVKASGLPPATATAFFRIFQEALTNVARHAAAKGVEATFEGVPEGWQLEIQDNGKGISGAGVSDPKALGLLGMRERAAQLGGSVTFSSRPGGGTVVTVLIPNNPPGRKDA